MRIEHDLPLPMIFMGEPLANCVKSPDCRCELASEARTNTGNELLLKLKVPKILLGTNTLKPEITKSFLKKHFSYQFYKANTEIWTYAQDMSSQNKIFFNSRVLLN